MYNAKAQIDSINIKIVHYYCHVKDFPNGLYKFLTPFLFINKILMKLRNDNWFNTM